MTRKQQNRLAMFLIVHKICEDNKVTLETLPHFAEYFLEFEAILETISTLEIKQLSNPKGLTLEKQFQKEFMIGLTMEIIRRVKAYAEVNELHELKGSINYSPSVLKKKAAVILAVICQLVHNETGEIVGKLGEYGVTDVMLDEQQEAIDRFMEMITLPRQRIIERKGATSELDAEFKRCTRVVQKMDKLVAMLETRNRNAFKSYRNARIVIDLRGRKTEKLFVEGIVKDSRDGTPLSNVRVWILGTQLIMITNIDGRFKIGVEKAGAHEVVFERMDFKRVRKQVEVNAETVVEMERGG